MKNFIEDNASKIFVTVLIVALGFALLSSIYQNFQAGGFGF
jgi:hypothetical protein